ncbi:MAG: S-layer homology domain-containing protein [Chloroflexi bacterium]|nr:S-layer homology domain-containing protein [Chloroflexota bacterium]
MKHRFLNFWSVVPILLALTFSAANLTPASAAATIIVSNANDSGAGSLRQAIADAGEGDTITFAGDYAIQLASELTIGSDLTIDGSGHSISVSGDTTGDGAGDVRVFYVNTGVFFNLNNLTVTKGQAIGNFGGGLYNNNGTVTITNSTFSGNSADQGSSIYNDNGTVNVTTSTFSGNSAVFGAGLFNKSGGVMTVTNSTLSDNSASVGGGIFNYGALTVDNSTFTGNSAIDAGGGGIVNTGTLDVTNSTFSGNTAKGGGGIYNTGTANVANSTFSENSTTIIGGGGIFSTGTLTALNTTFSGNNTDTTGGGIYSSGSATVKNTLVVKGTAGDNCFGTLDGTANAADDGSCGASFANTPNLHLGTLGNYGGPTQTIPLLIFSDAINMGDNATCSAASVNGKDQRGKARDAACDMGAYEFEFSQAGPTFTVTTAADYDDNACSDANCTLREALNAANANSDANTITFAANYTITLGNQLPAVTTAIVINGNGLANTIVQASDCNPVTLPNNCTPAAYRVFEVSAAGDLTLDGLTVQNGACSGLCSTSGSRGGGVYNAGTMTISNVAFSQNSANNNGGGMYNAIGSNATLTNVTFSANLGAGPYGGGGMANSGSNPILTNVTFSDNFAGGLVNGTTYDGLGGGMFNYGSSPQLTNVIFSQNSTNTFGYGGGMYNENNSSPTLTNVTFSDNWAGAGGGMYNSNSSSPALTDVLFSANSTLSRGGGMYNENNSNPTLTNVTFSGNTAGPQGGGMYNNSNPTLMNVTFSGNSAASGGGMFNGSGVPTLTNTIIANSASGGDCSGTLNAASTYNLIEGSSCGLTDGVNGNIVGQDPMLDILADNSGFTQTHALLAGSPATDSGTNTGCPATDQRGLTRPQGSHCDIGAYEYKYSTFADVPLTYWANSFIERLYNNGITGGCSASPLMYCPDSTVTRAQMAVFLLVAEHGTGYTPPDAVGIFNDVPASNGFAKWIEQLAAEGITGGCGGGNYCPNTPVTREQMAVFLLVAKHGTGYTPPAASGVFADVPADYPFAPWIEALAAEGITGGCGGGNFCPNGTVTRAQMAVFLVTAFNLP